MSRSKRKTPKGKFWYTSSSRLSDKDWKQTYNRKIRRGTKMITSSLNPELIEDSNFPEKKDVGDVWDSVQDGPKSYFGDLNSDRIQWNCWYRGIRDTMRMYEITIDNFDLACDKFHWSKWTKQYVLDDIKLMGKYRMYFYTEYELMETMQEKIQENKKLFSKMMRK